MIDDIEDEEVNEGVTEDLVAEDQQDENEAQVVNESSKEQSPQEINWKRANETMAHQSQLLKQKEQEIAQIKQYYATQRPKEVVRDGNDIPTYNDLDAHTAKVSQEIANLKHSLAIAQIEAREKVSVSDLLTKYGHEVPESVQKIILQSGDLLAAVDACKQTPSFIRDNFQNIISPNAKKKLDNLDKPKLSGSMGSSSSASEPKDISKLSRTERVELIKKYSRG